MQVIRVPSENAQSLGHVQEKRIEASTLDGIARLDDIFKVSLGKIP
jgi:hypothetical protein